MRQLKAEDLEGKTIVTVNTESVNVLSLKFSDETSLEIWADVATYVGNNFIPGFFVEGEEIEE